MNAAAKETPQEIVLNLTKSSNVYFLAESNGTPPQGWGETIADAVTQAQSFEPGATIVVGIEPPESIEGLDPVTLKANAVTPDEGAFVMLVQFPLNVGGEATPPSLRSVIQPTLDGAIEAAQKHELFEGRRLNIIFPPSEG